MKARISVCGQPSRSPAFCRILAGVLCVVSVACSDDDSGSGLVQDGKDGVSIDGTDTADGDAADTADTRDTADTAPDTVDTVDTVDTADTADTEDTAPPDTEPDTADTEDTAEPDTADTADTIEDTADTEPDTADTVDTADTAEDTADTEPDTADTADTTEDTADTTVADTADTTVDTAPDTAGPPCPLYQTRCEGVCVQTNLDPENCGGCGVTCDPSEVCSAGGCSSTCLSGLTPCNGTCVDVMTDSAHCGVCDLDCDPGEGCVTGSCRPTIPLTPPADCTDFPPIVVDIGSGDICLGSQAQTSFTWAICACENFDTSNDLSTDAYDSTLGPYEPGGTGGGIGVGGTFATTNKLNIGGTLWSASPDGTLTNNDTDIAHELHVGGDYSAGPAHVGKDAFIVGDIEANTLTIDGTLHQPAGTSITGNVTYGARIEEPVTVPQPCRCADDERVPVAAIIAAYTTANDNDLIGLESDALIDPQTDTHLALPCGLYYLDGISTTHKLTVIATGRSALFIGGDVAGSGEIQITVAPGAELDVFIGGTIDTSNKVRLGSANYPALMRVYIGGTVELQVSNEILIGAYIYGAEGPMRTSGQIEVFGGIFTKDLLASNKLAIHYDRAILGIGRDCEEPPGGSCDDCTDCGNQACIDGTCGACTSSADCCSPLVCVEGQCVSLGIIIDE